MASRVKTPAFIDTNLGTHIAIDGCPYITASDFKNTFINYTHLSCGKISSLWHLGMWVVGLRKKRKRAKKNHFLNPTIKGDEMGALFDSKSTEEWRSSAILENPSETASETVQVSGIIKKYFSDYEKYFSDYKEVTLSSNFTSRANQSQCKEQSTTGVHDNCSEAKFSPMPQFTPKTPLKNFTISIAY
ncbi:hypothetical protein Acr_19g0003030 [Actinidia rufa]|uniref:Uncharacterized protein n=1 Tax=Actinidia rufa TaxID=165716 RepID=A0A7J0G982_9ERIC|nr:hypothetical protein Acr_19g0003030 [Actinidia rufa]